MGCESRPSGVVTVLCCVSITSLLNDSTCPQNLSVGGFQGTPHCNIFLRPALKDQCLLDSWWVGGAEGWTRSKLWLLPRWSSASKMPTLLSLSMHFPGLCVEGEREVVEPPTTTSASSTEKKQRVRFSLHNQVFQIGDTEEGTVEIYSLSWF